MELEVISKARRNLSRDQIIFAEWLALPTFERSPKTQQDLAKELHISEQSICQWKRIPELWEVRDELIGTKGKELVVDAIAVLGKLLKGDNNKLAAEAAKDILDRWAAPRKHAHIIANIKDMYNNYH